MSPRHVPASAAELQRIGLFGSLSGETIAKLAARMVREQFAAGQPIVTEGERTDRFYVLLSGLANVSQDGRGARAVLRPGETFGEVAPQCAQNRSSHFAKPCHEQAHTRHSACLRWRRRSVGEAASSY